MITENSPPRRLELFEVLNLVEKAKSRKDKIAVLQTNESVPLKDYLRCVFDDTIQFNLPKGPAPYTPARAESFASSWYVQNRNLRFFVKGMSDKIPSMKRESVYLGILESVHPSDAEILVAMKDKKSTTKGLTKKLVQEAFPDLIKK